MKWRWQTRGRRSDDAIRTLRAVSLDTHCACVIFAQPTVGCPDSTGGDALPRSRTLSVLTVLGTILLEGDSLYTAALGYSWDFLLVSPAQNSYLSPYATVIPLVAINTQRAFLRAALEQKLEVI